MGEGQKRSAKDKDKKGRKNERLSNGEENST